MIDDDGYCTLSDLPADRCAHCQGFDSSIEKKKLGSVTTAVFEGICVSCGENIQVGDQIQNVGGWGKWEHHPRCL